MIKTALYRLLDNPIIFNISQMVLAPGTDYFLNKHFTQAFKTSKGFVLDIGCGPKSFTPQPNGKMVGLDLNFDFAKQYAQEAGRLAVNGSSNQLPFKDNSFNESRCFGLLHHLPEEQVGITIEEMIRCTKKGGDIIVFDSVWPRNPIVRPVPWLSHRFDRGRWVLTEEKLINLLDKAYPGKWKYYRFTYSFVGHEALMLTTKKD